MHVHGHGQNRRPRLAGRMAVFNGNSPNPCFPPLRSAETLDWLCFLRASKFNSDENYCKFESNLSRSQKFFSGLKFMASLTDFYSEEFAVEKCGPGLEKVKVKFEFPGEYERKD